MKKDLVFTSILSLVGVALFLLRFTGMPIHIVVSIIGAAVLVSYTILTKKDWKMPALEISSRAMYGIALISGIIIKISYVAAFAVIHKICAALFVVIVAASLINKLISENSKKD